MSESTDRQGESRRSWPWKLAELLFWVLVALATAVILVILSETLLPANF